MSERGPALTAKTEHAVPDRARARELFERLNELDADAPERRAIRDELVELHLPLVEYLARRFRNRGEWLDDLTQVATIGLIKSIDRFDLERGVEFSTYATPTIVGEIKRHFRDKGWAVRVPRRLQELKLSLTKAVSDLSQREGRSPTVAELAAHLQMTEEEVLEGLESANAYSTVSLDAPDSGDEDAPAVADSLGIVDESLEGVEYRESLKPLLEQLPPREKRILLLRFFGISIASFRVGGGMVNDAPWTAGSKNQRWIRRIVSSEGTRLYFDAPIYYHLNRALVQATVRPINNPNLITEAGIENLRVDIETLGGEDENHAWNGVQVQGAHDSWIRGVTALHFGYAGFRTAQRARDRYSKLLAAGLTGLILAQAVINLFAVMGLAPLTGVPLPFVSYGGSSLVVLLASVGVLLNIAVNERVVASRVPDRSRRDRRARGSGAGNRRRAAR